MLRARGFFLLVVMVSVFVYGLTVSRLASFSWQSTSPELLVTVPRFAQVIIAGGDRYLAANLAGFRVLVAETEHMDRGDFVVQARLQQDIAWFNPAHEDNYYIAANILPWNDELDAANEILLRAADARPFEWSPLFYLGFHYYHFRNDPVQGARFLLQGAERATVAEDKWAMQNLASKWIERGYEIRTAAKLVEAVAKTSSYASFQKYLLARASRLEDLARLRDLSEVYFIVNGRILSRLDELVAAGLIDNLPVDPLGFGFDLDSEGRPVLRSSPAGTEK